MLKYFLINCFVILHYNLIYSQSNTYIDSIYNIGVFELENNRNLKAFTLFNKCDSILTHTKIVYSNSLNVYNNLFDLAKDSLKINYFNKSLKYGNTDMSCALDLYESDFISENELFYYLDIVDSNYLYRNIRNHNMLIYRQIYTLDQFYYLKHQKSELLNLKELMNNLRLIFVSLELINDTDKFKTKEWYNKTLQLFLIHSARQGDFIFFKKMFPVYSKRLDNNFKLHQNLREYVDLYISNTRKKQFFGSFYGYIFINGKMELAPKISKKEFEDIVLNELGLLKIKF